MRAFNYLRDKYNLQQLNIIEIDNYIENQINKYMLLKEIIDDYIDNQEKTYSIIVKQETKLKLFN